MFEEGWVEAHLIGQREKQREWEEKERLKMKNPCGKMRKADNPYEVWKSFDGTWTWKVLKKYKSPEAEARDPYARWMCAVSSPFTMGCEDYGDVYVREIKAQATKVS
jgi:hypothetical protein